MRVKSNSPSPTQSCVVQRYKKKSANAFRIFRPVTLAGLCLAAWFTAPAAPQCTVDWMDVHQQIDGFGASSAFLTATWTAAQANMFFSTNSGIGLSLLRTQIQPGGFTRANQIPQSRFDPTIVPILNYVSGILKPNRPGIVPGTYGYWNNNFFNNTGTSITPNNRFSAKIDQSLGSKHHISYLMNRYRDLSTFGPAGPVGLTQPLGTGTFGYNATQVYRGTWDYTVTPTVVNRFYGGFNHFLEDHTQGEATETGSE